jgi:hypothetical protein
LTENEFQKSVIELARRFKWKCVHFKPAMVGKGRWVTPVQGDGRGFVDLVLVRDTRLLFAELKADKRYPSPEQRAWIDALRAAGQEVFVWRPADWDTIVSTLR